MARIRQLKPEFWTDDKIAGLSRDARLLFLGLLTEADDDGRLVDSPKLLAGSLFPFDDDVTTKKLTAWLDEIMGMGLVQRYMRGAASYLYVVNFKRHQKIAHPRRSSLPTPDDDTPNASVPHEERAQNADHPPADRGHESDHPPSERAPDLGIKGSRGQGIKGVGSLNNSSSNHHGVAASVGKTEEELIQNPKPPQNQPSAIDIIASRQLHQRKAKKNLGPVGDELAWLVKARMKALAEHGPAAGKLSAEGLTPTEIADRILPLPGSQYVDFGEKPEPETDIEVDENGRAYAVPRRSA